MDVKSLRKKHGDIVYSIALYLESTQGESITTKKLCSIFNVTPSKCRSIINLIVQKDCEKIANGVLGTSYNFNKNNNLSTGKIAKRLSKDCEKRESLSSEFNNLIEIWNNEFCPPFAKCKAVNKNRLSMFKKIRTSYEFKDILMVARYMFDEPFYNREDVIPNIEMLLRTTKFDSKYETASAKESSEKLSESEKEFLRKLINKGDSV